MNDKPKRGRPPGSTNKPKKPNLVKSSFEEPKPKKAPARLDSRYDVNLDDEAVDGLLPIIPKEIIPDGMRYTWWTAKVLGQAMPSRIASAERRGWTPVPAERHPGVFLPRGATGEIEIDGSLLMERPEELCQRSEDREKRKAREQVWAKEQQIKGGDVRGMAFDSQHPSAMRVNSVKKSYERIEVPED